MAEICISCDKERESAEPRDIDSELDDVDTATFCEECYEGDS